MTYQQCMVIGNVGADAELSYTPNGYAVCKFSVAVSKVTGKGDAKQTTTTWFRVVLWRQLAENLSGYIRKGDKIMVIGEVEVEAYTNKDGQPAASLELTGSEVKFLGGKGEGERAGRDGSGDPF